MPAEVSTINSPIHSITGRIREKVGAGVAKSGEELAVKFWLTAAALDQFLRASQNSSFVGVVCDLLRGAFFVVIRFLWLCV
jgi:hypothetical protein